LIRLLLALSLVLFSLPAFAQSDDDADRSALTRFIQNQLSAPNRQIRLNGIQGALSSNARIGRITVADDNGVWLTITNASLVWNRTALLRGRLSIDTLTADSIDMPRGPIPDKSLPSPEASPFQLPELPIAIILRELDVPKVTFGPTVFGLESELSVNGSLRLQSGELETDLAITRRDGPGGELNLKASFSNATRALALDLSLSEPADGVVANLLNMEGRPPIDLAVKGEGPVDNLDVAMSLDADGKRLVTGAVRLRGRTEGLGFEARLQGSIAELVAPAHREIFGDDSLVTVAGVSRNDGSFAIEKFDVDSERLTLAASGETTPDGFLRRLSVDGRLADTTDNRVVLPGGAGSSVSDGQIQISFGEAGREDWNGRIEVNGLVTDTFSADKVSVILGGLAQNLSNATARRITFGINGDVTGISSDRPEVETALGETISLDINGSWAAGAPITLTRASLTGNGLSANAAGEIADAAFNGTIQIAAASLAPFSQLADRRLAGQLDMTAKGEIRPASGGFDLVLDGSARGLHVDIDAADNLFSDETTITGGVARDENGFRTNALRLGNDNVELTANGNFSTGAADFRFDLMLADLALVTNEASGRLTAAGTAKGSDGVIALVFKASVPKGQLQGRGLSEASLGFDGTLRDDILAGKVDGGAFLDGHRVSLATDIALADGEKRLTGLDFTAGGTNLTGNLTHTRAGLIDGALTLDAPDISLAAALALMDATGSARADIKLSHENGEQNATVDARVRALALDGIQVGAADVQATIENLFGVPTVDGTVSGRNIVAAGYDVTTLDAKASKQGARTDFTANAALAIGTTIDTAGSLAPEPGGFRLSLSRADLVQGDLAARLKAPASVLIAGQNITIDGLAMAVGGGEVSANGTITDTLNLDVRIASLPLAIANTIKPELALGGTIDGSAGVTGTRDNPNIRFDVSGHALRAAALGQAGISSLDVVAKGTSTTNRLQIDATVSSPDGFHATASGAVPLGDGALDLDVTLDRFPLASLNAVAPGQDLSGTVSGRAKVTGPLANPAATFTVDGQSLSAAPLVQFGAAPLTLSAQGAYANQILSLSSSQVTGPQGLAIAASGRVPLSGNGLDVTVRGTVPLALANSQLAERGTQVAGTLSFDASVTGPLGNPVITGSFETANTQVVDPDSNVRLTDIVIAGSIDRDSITLRSSSARIVGGGSIDISGTVGIAPASGFPADIRIVLNEARYADGDLVVATVNGQLAVSGQLTRDPLISGDIQILRAEISVPEHFGGGAPVIDVIHVDPPAAVVTTLKRARIINGTPVPTARPSVVQLNIKVSAPNQIFVRGRGLDTELGGSVQLTGPVTNIHPIGGFRLIRGNLQIVGQRITFDDGTVTLIGDLDPFVDFTATSAGSDITVTVHVTGRVSDLNINFSSQPELPEDEVLAQLIFKRSLSELSAFQIAQLAAAAAELAGGGSTSLLNNLRQATGLDQLDVVTDSKGNAAVQAGRYIEDNIYLGVEAGAQGTTRGTVNLDITQDLKARGSVGSDGDSSLGLFFERDY
jgi:translocation and assembly module TamB